MNQLQMELVSWVARARGIDALPPGCNNVIVTNGGREAMATDGARLHVLRGRLFLAPDGQYEALPAMPIVELERADYDDVPRYHAMLDMPATKQYRVRREVFSELEAQLKQMKRREIELRRQTPTYQDDYTREGPGFTVSRQVERDFVPTTVYFGDDIYSARWLLDALHLFLPVKGRRLGLPFTLEVVPMSDHAMLRVRGEIEQGGQVTAMLTPGELFRQPPVSIRIDDFFETV